ncbi:peptide ABC transporter permease [Thermococcus chitonophagus]|uniref:Mannoside ABC transport system, permease protein 1 n=1 Tax=Thermococcus chitonophagus TaxID=54262 RepID=A0A170SEX2_9EURY|nr:ABC transporter permease [Thermococcus chitonophagus]ASJ16105.1 peptide ABC transporter permease [Thermococcus chitonophagus]CUX77358.1 Mannoside ABC transport system, permease protein 1 [Thermococcus chitonophagus]
MGFKNYLKRKIVVYLLTFFFAVTLNWLLPRLMPGNPIEIMINSALGLSPQERQTLLQFYEELYGLNKPLYAQFISFWKSLLTGNLGYSILYRAPVTDLIKHALPYDIAILLPAIVLSWIIGNWLGALAGKNKKYDKYVMPLFYFLASIPYFWFAMLLVYVVGVKLGWLPYQGAYSPDLVPSLSLTFIADFLKHWILPFLSLFIVMIGSWAIGMRNMIIYELEADYVRYLEALGASEKLMTKHAYRNAILPQVTGLALQLGLMVAGAIATEIVFNYPGVGVLLMRAALSQDYFLLQGGFLMIVIAVLVANFVIDIVYAFIDPRVRVSYTEG